MRVHDLRHTYATLMLENGIPVHKVAQVLGHSSPNVTSAVYSHVTKQMDADAISAMERILAGSA
jgi:integrase